MRVLVCGGRDYNDWGRIKAALDELHAKTPITRIIHGACCDMEGELRGADHWAEWWAIKNEILYVGFPAKWTKWGKPAGMRRNYEMAEVTKPELVVAFPGGAGTAGMVRIAKTMGIPVVEVPKT